MKHRLKQRQVSRLTDRYDGSKEASRQNKILAPPTPACPPRLKLEMWILDDPENIPEGIEHRRDLDPLAHFLHR